MSGFTADQLRAMLAEEEALEAQSAATYGEFGRDERPVPTVEPESVEDENFAVLEAGKPEKPAGMPLALPLHAIPRRQRAEAVTRLRTCFDSLKAARAALNDNSLSNTERYAQAQIAYADVEDLLVSVAAPGHHTDQMRAWLGSVEDEVLIAALAWYSATHTPGEASGSQSS